MKTKKLSSDWFNKESELEYFDQSISKIVQVDNEIDVLVCNIYSQKYPCKSRSLLEEKRARNPEWFSKTSPLVLAGGKTRTAFCLTKRNSFKKSTCKAGKEKTQQIKSFKKNYKRFLINHPPCQLRSEDKKEFDKFQNVLRTQTENNKKVNKTKLDLSNFTKIGVKSRTVINSNSVNQKNVFSSLKKSVLRNRKKQMEDTFSNNSKDADHLSNGLLTFESALFTLPEQDPIEVPMDYLPQSLPPEINSNDECIESDNPEMHNHSNSNHSSFSNNDQEASASNDLNNMQKKPVSSFRLRKTKEVDKLFSSLKEISWAQDWSPKNFLSRRLGIRESLRKIGKLKKKQAINNLTPKKPSKKIIPKSIVTKNEKPKRVKKIKSHQIINPERKKPSSRAHDSNWLSSNNLSKKRGGRMNDFPSQFNSKSEDFKEDFFTPNQTVCVAKHTGKKGQSNKSISTTNTYAEENTLLHSLPKKKGRPPKNMESAQQIFLSQVKGDNMSRTSVSHPPRYLTRHMHKLGSSEELESKKSFAIRFDFINKSPTDGLVLKKGASSSQLMMPENVKLVLNTEKDNSQSSSTCSSNQDNHPLSKTADINWSSIVNTAKECNVSTNLSAHLPELKVRLEAVDKSTVWMNSIKNENMATSEEYSFNGSSIRPEASFFTDQLHKQMLSVLQDGGQDALSDSELVPKNKKKKTDGDMLRSSIRQTECAFRYKSIAVKKHINFMQIILVPNRTKQNTLSFETLHEMKEALISAQKDPTCKVILLNSSGSIFCSGLDISTLLMPNKSALAEKLALAIKSFIKTLATLSKPLVAAVNGAAAGLGVTILPYCDVVFASDKATFYTPYSKLGHIPEAAATLTLPLAVGSIVASDMLLRGLKLTAQQAAQLGLVSEVLWPTRLMEEVIPRVQKMALQQLQSMELTKMMLRSHHLERLYAALDNETRLLPKQWLSSSCQKAFREVINNGGLVD